jgi:hypothetical protein
MGAMLRDIVICRHPAAAFALAPLNLILLRYFGIIAGRMKRSVPQTRNVETPVTLLLLFCAVVADCASAAVIFDGMTWYDSHSPSTMFLNGNGQLEWIPYNDHQIIVRIPDQNLSDTGDVVEISYWWLSDGQGNIDGCDDCQNEATCNFNKDITCVSGTGDYRVGLFESDGDYVTADGMGLENEIFTGYKGYKFCTQPHVDIEPVRWQEASGEPHIAGGFYERDMVDDPRLLSVNTVFDRISMYGGFELPLGQFSLWTIKLERLSENSVEMSITLNGITYTDIDTTNTVAVPQPNKIDVFAIEFPNPNPYSRVVLDIPCELGSANFNNDGVTDACDLAMLSDHWLERDACLPVVAPDANGLVLYYSFDGTLGTDVPNGLVDGTGTYTASIIAGTDPNSSIKYAGPNPTYNPGGTAAQFHNQNWSNYAGDTFLIDNSGGLNFAALDEFTVALFVNPSSAGNGHSRRLFSEYVYAYMYLDGDNTLHAVRKWGPGDWNENRTHLTTFVGVDQWSHVAMTWDADGAEDKFKLYVNGELAAGAAGTSAATLDSTAGFAIGGYQRENGSTAQFFLGRIDEFALYDYALSVQEIAHFAAAGQGHIHIPLETPANLHHDDTIDLKDFSLFALQWLEECP